MFSLSGESSLDLRQLRGRRLRNVGAFHRGALLGVPERFVRGGELLFECGVGRDRFVERGAELRLTTCKVRRCGDGLSVSTLPGPFERTDRLAQLPRERLTRQCGLLEAGRECGLTLRQVVSRCCSLRPTPFFGLLERRLPFHQLLFERRANVGGAGDRRVVLRQTLAKARLRVRQVGCGPFCYVLARGFCPRQFLFESTASCGLLGEPLLDLAQPCRRFLRQGGAFGRGAVFCLLERHGCLCDLLFERCAGGRGVC